MRILRSSEETAVILAVMMNRAKFTRARISDKTIRLISRRKRLKGSFRVSLTDDLAEFGFLLIDLDSSGQAIIKISSLEAAKSLIAKNVLSDKELKDLIKGTLEINAFYEELEQDDEDGDESE